MTPRYKKGALVWYLQRDGTLREAKVTISAKSESLPLMSEAGNAASGHVLHNIGGH